MKNRFIPFIASLSVCMALNAYAANNYSTPNYVINNQAKGVGIILGIPSHENFQPYAHFGNWTFYQDMNVNSHKSCAAAYSDGNTSVAMFNTQLGPIDAGWITFQSRSIPKAETPTLIKTYLTQTGESQIKELTAHLLPNPHTAEGVISIASDILEKSNHFLSDNHHFAIESHGTKLVNLTVKDGAKARAEIQKCFDVL